MGQQPRASDRAAGADAAPRPARPPGTRSLNRWVVLALLVEEPAHGFALARALDADGDLGRILTVRRPAVYRAIDQLVDDGLIEPIQTEPGDAGPDRTVYRPTAVGRSDLDGWLASPVAHVRELRVGFLLKLRLLERRGRSSRRLITAQRRALDETIERLIDRPTGPDADVVDRWRSHNAAAVARFFDELQHPHD